MSYLTHVFVQSTVSDKTFRPPPNQWCDRPQGQDEVPRGAVVTDNGDSVLIPSAIVNNTNEEIRKLGGEKVGFPSTLTLSVKRGTVKPHVTRGVTSYVRVSPPRCSTLVEII